MAAPTIEITPQDSGTVSCEQVFSYDDVPETPQQFLFDFRGASYKTDYYWNNDEYHAASNHADLYGIEATPNDGWTFDHFEIRVRSYSSLNDYLISDFTNTYQVTKNPTASTLIFDEPFPANIGSSWQRIDSISGPSSQELGSECLSVKAVFVKEKVKVKVTLGIHPQNAGTVEGGGEFDKGASCTISTTPKCSPWKFDHWELTPGGTVKDSQHTFTVSQDTVCVAHYTHTSTGKPYYDADDEDADGSKILCTPDGVILYDGDEVQ